MRTVEDTDYRLVLPDQYVYSAGSCVVYAEDKMASGNRFALNITDGNTSPYNVLASVTHTMDADNKTMYDISEIVRTLSEQNDFATLTGLYFQFASLTMTPFSIVAGLDLRVPAWRTPTMIRNVVLLAQQEVLVDFGTTPSATFQRLSGGTWTSGNTYTVTGTEPTASVMQITEGLTAHVEAVRLVDGDGVIMWQARIEQVKESCLLLRFALLRWRSDLFAKFKNYWFEVVNVERKQTEKISLMYQSGEIEHNGQFANERRNWAYYITVQTELATAEELRYFEDLFTSPEVTAIAATTGVSELHKSVRVAIDGTSKQVTYKPQRARLQFGVLVSKFWSL